MTKATREMWKCRKCGKRVVQRDGNASYWNFLMLAGSERGAAPADDPSPVPIRGPARPPVSLRDSHSYE